MGEMEKLQRRLIPVNIVVAVLALVAMLTLLFAPLLTIDVGSMATGMVQEMQGDNGNSDDESQDMVSNIISSIGGIKISISTLTMAQLAFASDPVEQVASTAADIIRDKQEDIFVTVFSDILPTFLAETNSNINSEKIDVKEIMNKFDGIVSAQNDVQRDQAIAALTNELQRQVVDTDGNPFITDDMKESIDDYIKEFYDAAKAELHGEEMTLESFICVTVSKIMDGGLDNNNESSAEGPALLSGGSSGSGNSSENSQKIYTNYSDLLTGILGMDSSSGDGGGSSSGIADMLEPVMSILQYVVYVLFFFAAIWFIQFLFAFFRIFTKNKRFTMWYTKIFGFIPCLIFGVAPLVAGAVVKSVMPEAAGTIGVILGAISSLTWISGACYIALWLVSIFWAYPIKKKIRRLKKEGAAEANSKSE